MKQGDQINLEVYGEVCCDYCDEIIHNHIDCPVCKTVYAPTDQYYDLNWEDGDVSCGECGSVFGKVNEEDSWYDGPFVKIMHLN